MHSIECPAFTLFQEDTAPIPAILEQAVWSSSPVSIQTQSLALRKWKPQETQLLALASSQSWLPLLRPSILANRNARVEAVATMIGKATMIGCLPMQVLAFLAVFVYATQAIAFEWKPCFRVHQYDVGSDSECLLVETIFSLLYVSKSWISH